MGFFDKRNDDDDSEVLEASEVLAAQPDRRRPPPPPTGDIAALSEQQRREAMFPTPPKMTPPPPPPAEPVFGIDDAIRLIRGLPTTDLDLVMQVVKKTLESVRVDVARIIEGAARRELELEARVGALKTEIESLEAKAAAHRAEIDSLENDRQEITTVKERLLLAQRLDGHGADTDGSGH
jgi:hypothetical protein